LRSSVRLVQRGGAHVLVLGDDENRCNPLWIDRINRALDVVEDGPAPLVTVGGAKFYCNGLDTEWLKANELSGPALGRELQALLVRVLTLPVPTTAAVSGHAFGAGALLAMAHDRRVMRSDRGYMCLPEVDLGIPFTVGMVAMVQSKLTPATASEAMTSGRRYTPTEALECGLIDQMADRPALLDLAVQDATRWGCKDPTTLTAIKKAMYEQTVAQLNKTVSGPPWS